MPIEVGATAPDFTLRNQNNEEITLSSFRGHKAVLLVFYPLAFTGICTGELCVVRDDLTSFQNDEAQILTVSSTRRTRTRFSPNGRATSSHYWPTSGRTARWPRRTVSSTRRPGSPTGARS